MQILACSVRTAGYLISEFELGQALLLLLSSLVLHSLGVPFLRNASSSVDASLQSVEQILSLLMRIKVLYLVLLLFLSTYEFISVRVML